ncbi:helix-turn-helix domain-containing protein [Clostridium tyrobutyricum]|uniref:helix-turn-helix domain-containing protein n=1 Tax=Clostridium tyrobutyricum TaxID=1519 RepID=UPI003F62ABF9
MVILKAAHKTKYRKLGLKISYYRKLKGLTQEQLAERLDKNLAFIGAVEAPNIDRTISLDTLFDIADILEIPAYKFLNFDED